MTASPSADRVRDEAERLVAAAITVISSATRGFGAQPGAGFANGSPECCVCPVCRAIAALRDPAPDLADKLAAGVGDLAAGVASILRTLSQRGPTPDDDAADPPRSEGDEWWDSLRRRAADAARSAARGGAPDEDDPWHVATNGGTDAAAPVSDAAPVLTDPPALATGSLLATELGTVRKTVAKKAVAKKAVAKKAVAKKAVATKPAGVAE